MSSSTLDTTPRAWSRRPTEARYVLGVLWMLAALLLATACSRDSDPIAVPRWDEARWDVSRWVTPTGGSSSAIAAGSELDAEPLRLVLGTVEDDVGTLRELVIDVRRTQVAVRDRVAALEASTSGASAFATEAWWVERQVQSLESVAGAGLQAGSLASSGSINSLFNVLANDLSNIHEFMVLLERESDAIAVRLAAIEDALDVVPAVEDDPTPFDVEPPVVAHVFVTRTLMRADDMNENLAAVSVTPDLLDTANAMMARHVDVFLVRITALEAMVGDPP